MDNFPDPDRHLTIESIANSYLVTAAYQVKQPTPSSTTAVHHIPTDDWCRKFLRFSFCETGEVLACVDGYLRPKDKLEGHTHHPPPGSWLLATSSGQPKTSEHVPDDVRPMLARVEAQRKRDAQKLAVFPDLLAACKRLLTHAEYREVKVDGEWGACREIDAIERDGDLPSEITEVRTAIAKARETD